jgi:hypothetical protein
MGYETTGGFAGDGHPRKLSIPPARTLPALEHGPSTDEV